MDRKLLKQCRDNPESIDWNNVSMHQTLSENFIREFKDYVNWKYISIYQILSENFIREFSDCVNWSNISMYQTLPENFIREFSDYIDWNWISECQVLSEDLIREFKDCVDWCLISMCQVLSEDFIREFKDDVNWHYISQYQILSEDFIREFLGYVCRDCISKYQKLSKNFIKAFNIKILSDSWRYKTLKEKLNEVKKAGYKIINGKIIAYKSVRRNMASIWKIGMVYEIGKYYRVNCDCLSESENSFGLSAWTAEGALKYYSKGKLLEVEIDPSDLGVIVYNSNKIRCFGLKVIREI